MIHYQEVALIETGVQDSGQYWLVIGQKLSIFLASIGFLLETTWPCRAVVAIWRILLLDDLHQSAYIDVVHFTNRQIYKSLRVHNLHCVLFHQFELHNDRIVLDIPQVWVFTIEHWWLFVHIDWLAFHELLKLLGFLAFNEEFVSIVGLLVDFVVLDRVSDLDEFGDRSFFQDFLTPLHHLARVQRFLLLLVMLLFLH